jgi:hypothetical protein
LLPRAVALNAGRGRGDRRIPLRPALHDELTARALC